MSEGSPPPAPPSAPNVNILAVPDGDGRSSNQRSSGSDDSLATRSASGLSRNNNLSGAVGGEDEQTAPGAPPPSRGSVESEVKTGEEEGSDNISELSPNEQRKKLQQKVNECADCIQQEMTAKESLEGQHRERMEKLQQEFLKYSADLYDVEAQLDRGAQMGPGDHGVPPPPQPPHQRPFKCIAVDGFQDEEAGFQITEREILHVIEEENQGAGWVTVLRKNGEIGKVPVICINYIL